jgi:hypothetical protein
MALIIEDGSGLSTAESYASVAYADNYFLLRNNTVWAALSTATKEAELRKATDYMIQAFRSCWQGVRVKANQALDWPRFNVYLIDLNIVYPQMVAFDTVPDEIKKACCELAIRSYSAGTTGLLEDIEQQVLSETIGPIAVTYDKNSKRQKTYESIEALLRPFFKQSGFAHGLVR